MNKFDINLFSQGGGDSFPAPIQEPNRFQQGIEQLLGEDGDWQKYLRLQQMMNPQQGNQQPMSAPQAPQIQSTPHQAGVGYRQPTYMRKGLLG